MINLFAKAQPFRGRAGLLTTLSLLGFIGLKKRQKRGLTCGVRRENPYTKFLREEAAAALELAKAAERLAGLEPTDLCNKSVNSTTGDWDSRDEWKPYTEEAKRRGLTCEDRKTEVIKQLAAAKAERERQAEAQKEKERQRKAAAAAERERKAEAKRQANLLALQTNPMSVALAEEVALSLPFEVSLVPQMNDLMLCVQGKFRKNDVLSAEISKRGIRCDKLLELMR